MTGERGEKSADLALRNVSPAARNLHPRSREPTETYKKRGKGGKGGVGKHG